MSWLAKLGAIAAALLGALVGVIVVFPFGLVVAEVVIFPLALGVAAVLATVGAGLAGTVLANDGTRTRLKPVLAVAEATAAVLAVLLLAYLALVGRVLPRVFFVPLIFLGAICSLVLALSAGLATWRFRGPRIATGSEVRLTLTLLALAVASVPLVIFLASLAGLTGA